MGLVAAGIRRHRPGRPSAQRHLRPQPFPSHVDGGHRLAVPGDAVDVGPHRPRIRSGRSVLRRLLRTRRRSHHPPATTPGPARHVRPGRMGPLELALRWRATGQHRPQPGRITPHLPRPGRRPPPGGGGRRHRRSSPVGGGGSTLENSRHRARRDGRHDIGRIRPPPGRSGRPDRRPACPGRRTATHQGVIQPGTGGPGPPHRSHPGRRRPSGRR